MTPAIEARDLVKRFGVVAGLDGVSLSVRPGELMGLLGPSGSGKTTLLRIVAGLEFPESGSLRFDGADALTLPAQRRGVGLVFQHYALFRHMSVFENVAFGLRVRPRATRPPKADIRDRVETLLARLEIAEIRDRFPAQISGGQRQRAALGRALATEPRLLLLDEPFGALDAKVRRSLRTWLRQLHDELGLTTLLVTHDQDEAMEMADRVVVLNRGRVEQAGAPADILGRPATPFVAEFLEKI